MRTQVMRNHYNYYAIKKSDQFEVKKFSIQQGGHQTYGR